MPDLFPHFDIKPGHHNYRKHHCDTCGHTKSYHTNDRRKLFRTKTRPCSKLGCDCKAFKQKGY